MKRVQKERDGHPFHFSALNDGDYCFFYYFERVKHPLAVSDDPFGLSLGRASGTQLKKLTRPEVLNDCLVSLADPLFADQAVVPAETSAESREVARFSTRQPFQKMHKIKGKKQQPFRGDECVV